MYYSIVKESILSHIISLANRHEAEIQALFDAYKQTPAGEEKSNEGLGPVTIALIVIVCVVFITAVIVVLGYCHMARKWVFFFSSPWRRIDCDALC